MRVHAKRQQHRHAGCLHTHVRAQAQGYEQRQEEEQAGVRACREAEGGPGVWAGAGPAGSYYTVAADRRTPRAQHSPKQRKLPPTEQDGGQVDEVCKAAGGQRWRHHIEEMAVKVCGQAQD